MAVTGAPELLIVMGGAAPPEQVDEVVARLDDAAAEASAQLLGSRQSRTAKRAGAPSKAVSKRR